MYFRVKWDGFGGKSKKGEGSGGKYEAVVKMWKGPIRSARKETKQPYHCYRLARHSQHFYNISSRLCLIEQPKMIISKRKNFPLLSIQKPTKIVA